MKQENIDKLLAHKAAKEEAKLKRAGKKFTALSTKEKDALLETLCRMMGLIE